MNIDIAVEPVKHFGDSLWIVFAFWNVIEVLAGFAGSGGADGPRVVSIVAVRPDGARRRLFTCAVPESEEKRARVERELASMPRKAWCSRYKVPEAFVEAPMGLES